MLLIHGQINYWEIENDCDTFDGRDAALLISITPQYRMGARTRSGFHRSERLQQQRGAAIAASA
jgi:hypothetical protein